MVESMAGGLPLAADRQLASRRRWIEVVLLTVLLAVWFGYELGTRALWSPDEGRYAEIAREMVATGDYVTPRLNGVPYFEKPPLVYWLTAGSMRLFGVNEWAARLWPAIFALIGCLVTYGLARHLYGRRAALFAVAVLALSPLYDFMGGTLTLDMALTAWLTAAMAAFLRGVGEENPRRRRWWFMGFYASIALAVLTKGLVGLVIPGMVIAAWMAAMGEWRLLRRFHLVEGLALFCAIAVPWHVLAAQANPQFAWFYFVHEHFERYLTPGHHREQALWFFVPVLAIGFFPWSALLPGAIRSAFSAPPGQLWRSRREDRTAWFLVPWAVLPFVFFSFSHSKLIPYVLPIVPPLALLVGRWCAQQWERRQAPSRAALWLLAAFGLAFSAVSAALPSLAPRSATMQAAVAQLGGVFYLLAVLWLVAGVTPWLAARAGRARAAWTLLAVSSAALVLTFDLTLARLDVGRSVKTLAVALAPRLGPGDEVMTWEEYFQDLPVYLGRRVTIAGWKGELEFGTTVEDTSAWMIDTNQFRRRWTEPHSIYLFVSRGDYAKLLRWPPGPMCEIDSNPRVVVVANKACTP